MTEFLLLKREGDECQPTSIVQAGTATELRELVKPSYREPGRYAICRWDNRREFDLGPGPVEATEVAA